MTTHDITAAETATQAPPIVLHWLARAAVATPLLALFAIAVGAPLYTQPMRVAAGTTRIVVVNAATLGVLLLLHIALVGLYVHAVHRVGRLGHLGFVTALSGTVLAAGGAWDATFALPYVAEQAPQVLDVPTSGTLLAGFLISYLVLVSGWAAVALAARRAGVVSRAAAIALTIGTLLALIPAPTALRLLPLTIGAALAGRDLLRQSPPAYAPR